MDEIDSRKSQILEQFVDISNNEKESSVKLHQNLLIEANLKAYAVSNARCTRTSISLDTDLTQDKSSSFADVEKYQ